MISQARLFSSLPVDLAMAGAFLPAISLSRAVFSVISNGSHAGKPVTQLRLCQRRSEMEVIERDTVQYGAE